MLDAPRVYRPVSALADYTEIIGHWHADVGYRSRALPRGAITLVIDVGRRQQLDVYAADGRARFMQKLGAPWVFGSDTPAALVEGHGWTATVTDMAVPGNAWKRWEHPAIPADVPGAPRGYFVEAMKA